MFPPTIHWYRDDQAARTAEYVDAANFGRTQSLEYLLLNDWDCSRDMPAEEHAKLIRALRADRRLEQLYTSGPTAVLSDTLGGSVSRIRSRPAAGQGEPPPAPKREWRRNRFRKAAVTKTPARPRHPACSQPSRKSC